MEHLPPPAHRSTRDTPIHSLPDELLCKILSLAATPAVADSGCAGGANDGSSSSGGGGVGGYEPTVSTFSDLAVTCKRWLGSQTTFRVGRGHTPSSSERVSVWDKQLALALSAPVLSAPALFRTLALAPGVTSVSLAECALDFYDDAFLASLISTSSRLVRLSLHEPRFTGAPHFRIGLKPLEKFFRLAAPRLQELTLSHCLGQMSKLPGSVASLTSLRVLRLHSKFFRTLPDGVCQLTALQELHLSCPLLLQLPEAFGKLRSVAQLSFSECTELRMLPNSFGDLSSLTSLRIDGSWKVHCFPDRIGALQRMRRLELRNFDGKLPDACEEWTKLEEVTLESCNKLQSLPASRIESLTTLTIRRCPALVPPRFDLVFASRLRHVTIDEVKSALSLESLSHLTSLERLDVAKADVNESFPVGLFALPSLAYVKVGSVKWVERDNPTFWQSILQREQHLERFPGTDGPDAAAEIAAEAMAASRARYPPLGRSLRQLHVSVGWVQSSEGWLMSAWLCSLEWLTHLTVTDLDTNDFLPAALGSLRSLRSLSLSGRLHYLPSSLALLAPSLQSLTLNCNRAYCKDKGCPSLPDSILQLSSLTYLHLTNIQLWFPTPDLGRLTSLRTLLVDYSDGSFRDNIDLPKNIRLLRKLERLELRGCRWHSAPPMSLCELPSLKKFHFDCDNLRQLPAKFYKLTRLEELAIETCYGMKQLPAGFGSLGALKKLSITGTRSPSFLDPLCGLPSLEEVTLNHASSITSLPPAFCQFSRLHTLTITHCDDLISLPANIGALVSLKRLSIRECRTFQHLPDSFSALASLVHLTVTNCPKFSTLPDGFGSLLRLTRLEITLCDSFTHLPASFPSLPSLRVACFSLCKQLHSLPSHMGQLPRLEVLQLRQCFALKTLPSSLREAEALRHVDVYASGLSQEGGDVEVCGSRVHVVRGKYRKPEQVGPAQRRRRPKCASGEAE